MKNPGVIVSFAPHIHCGTSIPTQMYTITLSLFPAMLFGLYQYGVTALMVISLSIITCVMSEYGIQKMFKKQITVADGSAVLSGLLFALILPHTSPFWLVIVGAFMSMLVGKHVFGGLGSNPFNSVLVGWAIVKISWKPQMDFNLVLVRNTLDTIFEYPLGMIKAEGTTAIQHLSMGDLFIGYEIGGIGSTSALLLGVGGMFLMTRGIIQWRIPAAYIVGVIITSLVFNLSDSTKYTGPLVNLLSGYTMIGIFYLATDYSSSPVNAVGSLIFGFGCGFLTILLRSWSYYPDGTIFAILLMNILTPYLDKIGQRHVIKIKKDI